ncbi:MAG: Lrp/AsnC ligand binding domain-containing protein [Symbiopectobacterium sp.]
MSWFDQSAPNQPYHQLRVALSPDVRRNRVAIIDACKTTGDADYLLKIAVADLQGLSYLISRILSQNKSVSHLKTSVVLNSLERKWD